MSILERVHLVAGSLWLGALLSVGGVAAAAFPIMKSLQPALPGFRVPVLDHWSIAAGHVMNPAFFVLMIAGVALGAVGLVCWRSMGAVRRGLSVCALALASGTLLGFGLPMRGHLEVYWAAAREAEIEAAEAAKARFEALHPWSSRAMGLQAVLVGASVLGAVAARPGKTGAAGGRA